MHDNKDQTFHKGLFSHIVFQKRRDTKKINKGNKTYRFLCVNKSKKKSHLLKIQKTYNLHKSEIQALVSERNFCVFREGVFAHILLFPTIKEKKEKLDPHQGSELSLARDIFGYKVSHLDSKCNLEVISFGLSSEQKSGLMLGLELATYKFKKTQFFDAISKKHILLETKTLFSSFKRKPSTCSSPSEIKNFGISLTSPCHAFFDSNEFVKHKAYSTLGAGVNIARHLTNLPPNVLSPRSYAMLIKNFFSSCKKVRTELWTPEDVKKNKMGLLYAVGSSHPEGPYFVKVMYRPTVQKKPKIIFVGKGITFDSGGLDIKPATAMRFMKKDMAGSAALVGLCHFMSQICMKVPCDFFIPIAENSVSGTSFRPGDIFQSRGGRTVEIHHTDAEGRLILADALELAVESQPKVIVNVATLTGATRVGLGLEVGGLYGNDLKLCRQIFQSGFKVGDPLWMMPIVKKYRQVLNSSVADVSHAADGFGGGIRAASFLKDFVGDLPWAHLDIYGWNNAPTGAYSEAGASGQGVQVLGQWLLDYWS